MVITIFMWISLLQNIRSQWINCFSYLITRVCNIDQLISALFAVSGPLIKISYSTLCIYTGQIRCHSPFRQHVLIKCWWCWGRQFAEGHNVLEGYVCLRTDVCQLCVPFRSGRFGPRRPAQHLHHDGLFGCAEGLYCLLVSSVGQVFAIYLDTERIEKSVRAKLLWWGLKARDLVVRQAHRTTHNNHYGLLKKGL